MTRSPEMDPRQMLCWQNYIDPDSETFADATNSARKAGYGTEYAREIKQTKWFISMERRIRLRSRGEEVLEEMLDMPVTVAVYKAPGSKEISHVTTDPSLVKIKQDTAKFAVERLGKEDWSTRQEHSGPNGKDLPTPILGALAEPPK